MTRLQGEIFKVILYRRKMETLPNLSEGLLLRDGGPAPAFHQGAVEKRPGMTERHQSPKLQEEFLCPQAMELGNWGIPPRMLTIQAAAEKQDSASWFSLGRRCIQILPAILKMKLMPKGVHMRNDPLTPFKLFKLRSSARQNLRKQYFARALKVGEVRPTERVTTS